MAIKYLDAKRIRGSSTGAGTTSGSSVTPALTSGSGYSVTSASVALKTAANGVTSYAYDTNTKAIEGVAVKWYYNDSLLHTSAVTTATVFAKISNYYQSTGGHANKQTTLTTTDTSITWTLTGSGYPSTDTVMNFGADDDNSGANSGSGFYDMRFAFQVDGASKLTNLKENGSNLTPDNSLPSSAVATGDTFKLEWFNPQDEKATLLPDDPTFLSETGGSSSQLDESANKYGVLLASNNPLIGKELKSLTMKLKAGQGSPTGNISAKIYKSDSTTATATSTDTVDASALTSSFVEKTWNFATGVTLASGDRIVFEGGSHDGSNQITFERNSSSFTDTASIARYTSSWVDGIAGDALYKIGTQVTIPENTIFEEIDTYKTWWLQDGAWGRVGFYDPDATLALFCGGHGASGYTTEIDRITIATLGNAVDFGDTTSARGWTMAVADATRGVIAGGGVYSNVIDYVTVAGSVGGTATAWGANLSASREQAGSCCNNTHGLFCGGYGTIGGGSSSNQALATIDHITIATAGTVTDFGDLQQARYGTTGCSTTGVLNSSHGMIICGAGASPAESIQYLPIGTTGTASDFGDCITQKNDAAAVANPDRAVVGAGVSPRHQSMDYFAVGTTGTAADFGDLNQALEGMKGANNGVRGCMAGGNISGNVKQDDIEYITIATLGNGSPFGDLTAVRQGTGGCAA